MRRPRLVGRSAPGLATALAAAIALVPPVSSLEAATVEVTLTEGTNLAAALSPDGRRLVIDVQGTLWVLPIAGGRAQAITDRLGDARQPAWSPDGSRIAFQSYRDGNWHIWTVAPDGSELQQLTRGLDDDREPTWTSDGRALVFASDRAGNYDLWQLDLRLDELRQLTEDPANEFGGAVDPSSERIVFVSERAPRGLWLLEPGEGDRWQSSPLAEHSSTLAAPSWSPDGERILVQSYDRTRSETRLLSFRVGDDSEPETISPEGQDVFPFRAAWLSATEYLYTADGAIQRATIGSAPQETIPFAAVVSLDRPEYRRKVRDFDGTAPRRAKGILNPSVSPDGRRIAFAALGDLYIREATGEMTRLTDDRFVDAQPKWSPDGKTLVYVSDRSGKMEIWLRDLESGVDSVLPGEGRRSHPVFSPDGKELAFYQASPANPLGATLHSLQLASGKLTQLHDEPVQPTDLSWARNGAASLSTLQRDSTRFREGTYQILVASASEPRYLDPTPGLTLNQVSWAPDGRSVAFVQEGVLKVATVDARGDLSGAPRVLASKLAEAPSWSGDSGSVVFQSGDRIERVSLDGGAIEELPVDLEWQPAMGVGRTVIHAGRVFNGRDQQARENVDLVIEDNRIVAVEPHADDHHTGTVIDATGKTVLPGLFEMHAHQSTLLGESLGRSWLAFGVTSVREPGTNAYDALERRESWASGRRHGPRLFFSGPLLDGNRVYYAMAEGTSSPGHVDLALQRAEELDYDLIKTYVRLPDETQGKVADFAHRLGIPTSSHEVYPAAAYGMDAVEHAGATSRRGYSPKQSQLGATYGDVIEILARAQMNQTPTLVLPGYFLQIGERPELLENPQFQAFYGDQTNQTLGRARMMGSAIAGRVENQGRASAAVVAAGGRITAGTDSPFVPYGFGLHVELQLLVRGGLEPWQALRSATLWAAEAIGVAEDLGSIEPGKVADLIIVDGNPLSDIADTLKVETTIHNGRVFPLEELLESP